MPIKYRISEDDCIGCEACIAVCPYEAITGPPFVVNAALCDGCGVCAEECGTGAISSYDTGSENESFGSGPTMGIGITLKNGG